MSGRSNLLKLFGTVIRTAYAAEEVKILPQKSFFSLVKEVSF